MQYQRWLDFPLEESLALKEELLSIKDKDEEISFDRFYQELAFGTAGTARRAGEQGPTG